MTGSLAQRAPCDVLGEVRRRQASGILRFENEGASRQVFIDTGNMIRFAASNVAGESITHLFREQGRVTDDQIREATARKLAEELLGTTLARLGFLTRSLLTELTNEHIRRVLKGILELRRGNFEFQQGALPFREQLDGGISASVILLQWSRGLTDVSWIEKRLGPQEVAAVMSRRPPEGYQKIPLTPAEGYTMSRVDGRATIREICMVSPMGEEVALRALFGLVLAGILEAPEGGVELPLPPDPNAAAPVPRPAAATAPAPRPAPAPAAAPASRTAASAPAAAPTPAPRAAAAAGAPSAGASPAGVAPARTPGNGGAPKPAGPARTAPPRPGAHAAGGRPGPTAPRRVTGIAERVRPATSPDLEAEMLRRFEQIHEQDLYQVLGVATGAGGDEIRRAYYALAKRLHPDKFTREDMKAKAEKVFGHITEAYATLSGEATRKKYDEDLQARRSPRTQATMEPGEMARQNFRHGRDCFDKGRFGESISFFQNACDQDPSKAEHFYWLGLAQSRNPRWKKDAEESFLKAIDIDPTNADCYAHLGTLYSKGGLHAKAREMFKKALEWDPTHATALEGMEAEEGGKKGLLGMFKR